MNHPSEIPEDLKDTIAAHFITAIMGTDNPERGKSLLALAKFISDSQDIVELDNTSHLLLTFYDASVLDVFVEDKFLALRIGQSWHDASDKPAWAEQGKSVIVTSNNETPPKGVTIH